MSNFHEGMMEMTTKNIPADLGKTHNPVIGKFDDIVRKWFAFSLKMFFFFVPLTIGLHKHQILLISPLMKLSAQVLGFCASFICWLVAWVIPRFVFGVEYEFVEDVYYLYLNDDFSITISLIFLLLLFSRIIVRTIDNYIKAEANRKFIFIISILSTIISGVLAINYINLLDNPNTYLFGLFVIGVIYFLLMIEKKNIKNIPDDVANPSIGLFK